jgi:NAD(P)-dependent dehydrogenase (short-subunit alcohol dehydrogenase family)
MARLTRSVIWISGASSGIGAALAASVPFEDAVVVDISRRGGTPGTEHLGADLADPDSWSLVAEDFATRLDGFAGDRVVFVHNAGTLEPMVPAAAAEPAAYERAVLLNSAAPQVLGQAFLRAVDGLGCEQHLLILSSGAARTPYEGWTSYGAGKAAVDQWVRAAGLEQDRRDVPCRVIAVAPGVVDTAMQQQIRESSGFPRAGRFRDLYASGGLTDPADAARGIWSLLGRDLPNGSVVDLRDL